jgi:predicted RNA-binding protein (virulence factor B family)
MIHPGRIQELEIMGEEGGFYLLGNEKHSVRLKKREARKDLKIGDSIKVFVFYNEDAETEATTRIPQTEIDQPAAFRVKNVNEIGAFIDIGTTRDILIPTREMREPLETGQVVVVVMKEDRRNRRLYASTRLTTHLSNHDINYKRGDEVEIMIAEKILIGRRVIINGKHLGVLFRQEMLRKVFTGEKMKGYIRQIEGKDITVSTQKEGMELLHDARRQILDYLSWNGGYARLNDDTPPEEINLRLKMSKKTFKKAIGMLFKEGEIVITKFGIKLAKKDAE